MSSTSATFTSAASPAAADALILNALDFVKTLNTKIDSLSEKIDALEQRRKLEKEKAEWMEMLRINEEAKLEAMRRDTAKESVALARIRAMNQTSPEVSTSMTDTAEANVLLQKLDDNGGYSVLPEGGLAEDALMSEEELNVLSEINSEADLVVQIIALFSSVLPDLQVVNSETSPWLRQGTMESKFDMKPDGFITCCGQYVKVKNGMNVKTGFGDVSIHYGVPPKGVWDTITVFEAKLEISMKDWMQVVRYMANLPPGALCVLFDRLNCFLVTSGEKRTIVSIVKMRWVTPNSKSTFISFVRGKSQLWLDRLNSACSLFDVRLPDENAFLGSGATGRVFKVLDSTNSECALKIVDLEMGYSLVHEALLLKAAKKSKVVVDVVEEPKILDNDVGVAFLISPVGKAMNTEQDLSLELCIDIMQSLRKLHDSELWHGDPRLANLIRDPKSNRLLWIDFRESYESSSGFKTRDMEMLCKSIMKLRNDEPLDSSIQTLVKLYEESKAPETEVLARQLAKSCYSVLRCNGVFIEMLQSLLLENSADVCEE
ncbi:hypothetical protein BDR26DRAFT_860806 [Obelidium mucronatum]|nr:hypothetical protein BDR26DRAFT_860806 [Obelidium mucronatum]